MTVFLLVIIGMRVMKNMFQCAGMPMMTYDRCPPGKTHLPIDGEQPKLDKRLHEVAEEMLDLGTVYRRLEESGVDLARLPLCRLTKRHVAQAGAALGALRFVLENAAARTRLSEDEEAEIVTASYQLYAAIPHLEETEVRSMATVDHIASTLRLLSAVECRLETMRFGRTPVDVGGARPSHTHTHTHTHTAGAAPPPLRGCHEASALLCCDESPPPPVNPRAFRMQTIHWTATGGC